MMQGIFQCKNWIYVFILPFISLIQGAISYIINKVAICSTIWITQSNWQETYFFLSPSLTETLPLILPIIFTSVAAIYNHCMLQVLTNLTPQQSNTPGPLPATLLCPSILRTFS